MEFDISGFIDQVVSNPQREQHYSFTHHLLPMIVIGVPEKMRRILTSSRARDYLIDLWNQNGKESEEKIPADGLECRVTNFGKEGLWVVITLPEPVAAAEAYYVGAYFFPMKRRPFRKVEQKVRYFTLEKSFTAEGQPRAILGEWAQLSHSNFGEVPEPSIECFTERVRKVIAEENCF